MQRWGDEAVPLAVSAEEAVRSVIEVMSVLSRVTVSAPARDMLIVDERWRPVWTYVLAVVLFPVGLIALAATRHHRLVITTEEAETPARGTCLLRVEGSASGLVSDTLWAILEDLSE